jgi:hypothetical protein
MVNCVWILKIFIINPRWYDGGHDEAKTAMDANLSSIENNNCKRLAKFSTYDIFKYKG